MQELTHKNNSHQDEVSLNNYTIDGNGTLWDPAIFIKTNSQGRRSDINSFPRNQYAPNST